MLGKHEPQASGSKAFSSSPAKTSTSTSKKTVTETFLKKYLTPYATKDQTSHSLILIIEM